MMSKLIILSVLAVYVYADCAKPNGTATATSWFNCDGSWPLTLTGLSIEDDSGAVEYPWNPSKKLVVSEKSTNSGGEVDKVLVDVSVYHYASSGSSCVWKTIPTLGLLNNIDGCAIAKNCPLQPGAITFKQEIDLTPFQTIIHALGNNQVYQLKITTKDGNKTPIGCVYIQGLLSF